MNATVGPKEMLRNRVEKDRIGGNEKWFYGYDNANHLVSVERKSNGTDVDLRVNYAYDAFGVHVKKIVDSDGDGTAASITTLFALKPQIHNS